MSTANLTNFTLGKDANAEQRAVFDELQEQIAVDKVFNAPRPPQLSSKLDSKGYTPKAPKAAPKLNEKVASGMNKSLGNAIAQGQSLQSKFGSNKPAPIRYSGRYGL